MADEESSRSTIRIVTPTTEDEWGHADVLIAELKKWDVQQSQALGFDGTEVLNLFYPDDLWDIRRDSAPPDGRFLLAIEGSLPVGCAAFRRLTSTICEIYDVYVRPGSRGRGLGYLLMRRLMSNAELAGYQIVRLETAMFMHDAHKLYRSLHFQVRDPYRAIPSKLVDATMWMECKLP
jgi:GNAT superfamily N-acetyltransferase